MNIFDQSDVVLFWYTSSHNHCSALKIETKVAQTTLMKPRFFASFEYIRHCGMVLYNTAQTTETKSHRNTELCLKLGSWWFCVRGAVKQQGKIIWDSAYLANHDHVCQHYSWKLQCDIFNHKTAYLRYEPYANNSHFKYVSVRRAAPSCPYLVIVRK